jgi:hypothetical protein
VIAQRRADGRDEVGQREQGVRLVLGLRLLLAQHVEAQLLSCARLVGVEHDVVAVDAAGQKP